MTAPLIPSVGFHFLLNVLLQLFDGLLSYHALSEGVPEVNPFVNSTIAAWGIFWGLLYWKTLACALLALIFALRHKQRALTIKAFTLTGLVYGYVFIASLTMLLL
jgi:Domain of unknown function (DUF5658)